DVVVEEVVDLTRLRQLVEAHLGGLRQLLLDDLVAEIDALVADVHTGTGDQLLDLLLRLAAEGALQQVSLISELGHYESIRLTRRPPLGAPARAHGSRSHRR